MTRRSLPSPHVSRSARCALLAALEADLADHAKRVIATVRRQRPEEYLRIVVGLLPEDSPVRKRVRRARRKGDPAALDRRRRRHKLVTAERLRALLDYAPETGRFRWRARRGAVRAGREAGHRTAQGYRIIGIDRRHYMAHRLAWLYVHGEHPPDEIDHINGDPTDDRIANLRPCSRAQNARNVRGNRTSRFKGVYRRAGRTLRFVAHIHIDGRQRYLGSFANEKEAWAAYKAAALRHYGEFARVDEPGEA